MAKRGQSGLWSRTSELVGFLEAAYQLETEEHVWLSGVMEASLRVWARGGWVHGAIFDASEVAAFRSSVQHVIDGPDTAVALLGRGQQLFTPGLVARSFRVATACLSRQLAQPELREVYSGMAALGYSDALAVNGVDPSGHGVFIGLWSSDAHMLPSAELTVYRRMAHHLAAAHRYRRRISAAQRARPSFDATDDAEAVLDGRGRVLHAIGPAKEKCSQAELIQASQARDLARVSRADNHELLRRWLPLTSARWTLVDSYQRGGQRYVIARENQVRISALSMLSDRERQVVAYLAIRQSTKEIAYALGISDATVRVLLARAAVKLGVKTRRALLAHPEVRPLVSQ
jgi:DNA-binding CsgD family transcriptional regulator